MAKSLRRNNCRGASFYASVAILNVREGISDCPAQTGPDKKNGDG